MIFEHYKDRSHHAAEFFVDGGVVAGILNGGRPDEVIPWLCPLIPYPFSRKAMIVRLALAQCDIIQRRSNDVAFLYDIKSDGPRLYIGGFIMHSKEFIEKPLTYLPLVKAMDKYPALLTNKIKQLLADPKDHDDEPYIDSLGFVGRAKTVDGPSFGMVVAEGFHGPRLTYGCKWCGTRFSTRAMWAEHNCKGIPKRVDVVNRLGGVCRGDLPIDFESESRIT